jgi:hypothetical protein
MGNRAILFISHFLMTWVTGGSLLNIYAAIRKIKIGVSRYTSWKEHFIITTIYWLINSLVLSWSCMKLPNKWCKCISFLFMKLMDWTLERTGFIKYPLFSNPLYAFFQVCIIYLVALYKKWTFQIPNELK